MMGNRCIFKIAYRKRPLRSLGFIQLRKGFFGGLMTEPKKRFKTSFNSVQIKILFEFTRFQTFSLRSTVVVANKLGSCFSLSCYQLYDSLPEGESPSAEKVMDSFSSWYSKDETEEVFGEDTEYDEYRKVQSNPHTRHALYTSFKCAHE